MVGIKKISPYLRVTIGWVRLAGDVVAWFCYKDDSPAVAAAGIAITLLNLFYIVKAMDLTEKSKSKTKRKK